MIKKLNLFFILLPFIYNNLAFAASTCFPETIGDYYGHLENPDSAYDWRASYDSGKYLRGVGICAVNSASSEGTAITNIYRSRTSSSYNNECWCKLTYPIESKFIYYHQYPSESECATSCPVACPNSFISGSIYNIGQIYFDNPEGE